MYQLKEHHWKVVKHILHYLTSTKHYGLFKSSKSSQSSIIFIDANWNSDLNDLKSTIE